MTSSTKPDGFGDVLADSRPNLQTHSHAGRDIYILIVFYDQPTKLTEIVGVFNQTNEEFWEGFGVYFLLPR